MPAMLLYNSLVTRSLRLLVAIAILLVLPLQGIAAVTGCVCPGSDHDAVAAHGHAGTGDDHSGDHHEGHGSHANSAGCGTCCCTTAGIVASGSSGLPQLSYTAPDDAFLVTLTGTPPDELYRPPLAG